MKARGIRTGRIASKESVARSIVKYESLQVLVTFAQGTSANQGIELEGSLL